MRNNTSKDTKQNTKRTSLLHRDSTHSDELSGWNALRNPAAIFSAWGKIKKPSKGVDITIPMGVLSNDNSGQKTLLFLKPKTALLIFSTVLLGTILSMNSSTMATQTVLHINEQALSTTMEYSPNAVAHLLNAVQVGE